jgi:hypothetical protein
MSILHRSFYSSILEMYEKGINFDSNTLARHDDSADICADSVVGPLPRWCPWGGGGRVINITASNHDARISMSPTKNSSPVPGSGLMRTGRLDPLLRLLRSVDWLRLAGPQCH